MNVDCPLSGKLDGFNLVALQQRPDASCHIRVLAAKQAESRAKSGQEDTPPQECRLPQSANGGLGSASSRSLIISAYWILRDTAGSSTTGTGRLNQNCCCRSRENRHFGVEIWTRAAAPRSLRESRSEWAREDSRPEKIVGNPSESRTAKDQQAKEAKKEKPRFSFTVHRHTSAITD
jgi:hypothetical protein